MKSVAIVGFSHLTFDGVNSSKVDEIWTLNHAFVLSGAFPRFDRVFEIHKYGWFLRSKQYRLHNYKNWLRRKHPFPIYMQKEYKSFPSSVRYPIEEINKFVFGKLLRNGQPNLYYTSSFGYMFGLAVYEGFDHIEIYGIDMTNDTEYNYQKPAGEFMIGFALGKGVEVILHPNSHLCKAQFYGYDRVPAADRKRAEELLALYERERTRYKNESDTQARLVNNGMTRDAAQYMQATAYLSMYSGAIQFLNKQLSGDEYYFGRQHLETDNHKHREEEEKWLAETNMKHSAFQVYSKIDTDGQTGKVWKEYLNARSNMFMYSGARQVIQKLIDECDMKVVPDGLRLEIKDE